MYDTSKGHYVPPKIVKVEVIIGGSTDEAPTVSKNFSGASKTLTRFPSSSKKYAATLKLRSPGSAGEKAKLSENNVSYGIYFILCYF